MCIIMKKFLLLLAGVTLLVPTNICHAYLDPGTGSMMVQLIAGGVLTVVTAIGMYWSKIKMMFTGDKKQKGN